MNNIIHDILRESISVKQESILQNMENILACAEQMAGTIGLKGRIFLFGNGGSAADAQHIAAEFVNRFRIERNPLPGIALTTDTSVLTSIGNDYGFDYVFEKQIRALAQKGDMALGISTSGNSPNVVKGLEVAKEKGLFTVAFTGKGGKAAEIAEIVFTVNSEVTARIQETHILIGHLLCELTDRILFPDQFE